MSEIRFSIIVRCAGVARRLPRLIEALGDLDYPPESFEVIVADTGAKDGLDQTARLPETRFPMVHLHLPGLSRPAALNVAVRESRGELLAFLDEGCIPVPDWLKSYDRAFDAWLAGVIGGSFHPPKDGDAYQKCVGLVHSSLARSLGLVTGQQIVGRYYPRSGNMAARRESVLLAGGFDEEAAECPEIRMAARMQHIGYRTFYCPDAAVHYYQDSGLLNFVAKDFRTASERARFCGRSGINFFALVMAALILIVLGLAFNMHDLALRTARLTASGYALVLALSSVHAAVSVGSLAVAFFLPLFLVVHHAAYALGFAVGRVRKA